MDKDKGFTGGQVAMIAIAAALVAAGLTAGTLIYFSDEPSKPALPSGTQAAK